MGGLIFLYQFKAPQDKADIENFIIPLNLSGDESIKKLYDNGYIKHQWTIDLVLSLKGLRLKPGGYQISKDMNVLKIVKILTGEPHMKWVVIPEGLRKEEIYEIFAKNFNWNEADRDKFLNFYKTSKDEYYEGVYFPDTYLLPADERGEQVAERIILHFNEKFSPYRSQFLKENIKWNTALKIASLVQREAANKKEMPLVAGIIWNRLLNNMKLDIDATLQYARGKTDAGWWAPVKLEDKKNKSYYNTYIYAGLPPHPICNPGIAAIEAVLKPEKTPCFYYLHDANRQIHCSKTYEEHLQNIKEFLQ